MSKFADNFWGSEFCSTAGYDHLVRRLKEGKKVVMDIEDYLEKRAKIEKDYGESLMNLARRPSGKDEIGSLRRSWDELKAETEATGKVHLSLSQRLMDDLNRSMKEFREQQRDVRKKCEDTVKRSAAHKKACYEKNNRLKTTYESKCRDADRAEEQYNRAHSTPTIKPQDLARSQKRMETTRTAANNADTMYQEAIKNLEDARQLWEREMDLLCQRFQELEEQRISYVRHQLWTYCNFLSQTAVSVDEAYENVRKVLEDCNVDADIDLFVRERATGTERPPEILYENYYHPTQTGPIAGSGVRVAGAITLADHHHKELPPLPPEPEQTGAEDTSGLDSVYSSIPEGIIAEGPPEAYYASPRPMDRVIAVYDYESQGGQELNLEEGDIVQVIAKEDDVWWCGQLKGKMGMFPSSYVETYDGP